MEVMDELGVGGGNVASLSSYSRILERKSLVCRDQSVVWRGRDEGVVKAGDWRDWRSERRLESWVLR